jgi:ABC-type spermidine/putrescine transport system permease subunit I
MADELGSAPVASGPTPSEAPLPAARGSGRAAIILLLPGLLVFFLLFVLPQAGLLAWSFQPTGAPGPNPTLDNYARFLGDPHYLGILIQTLVMGIEVTLIALVLGYPLAYWLARTDSRWKTLLLLMTVFPLLTSAVVRSFGWMVLLYRTGLVSNVLRASGLARGPVELMYSQPGVVIAMTEVLLPFMVLTLYGVIQSIDRDLEDAAMNLGDGPAGALVHVTLPLSMGGILAGSLLVFSLAISSFVTPSLVGGPRVQVMATTIYDQTISLLNWQFASAVAAILLVVVLALALGYSRVLENTMRSSS